jgi:hypothetical protein
MNFLLMLEYPAGEIARHAYVERPAFAGKDVSEIGPLVHNGRLAHRVTETVCVKSREDELATDRSLRLPHVVKPRGAPSRYVLDDTMGLGHPLIEARWDHCRSQRLLAASSGTPIPSQPTITLLANICFMPRSACRVRSSFSMSENRTCPSP